MPSESPSDDASRTAASDGLSIADHLPPNPWALELCYQCIRMHEEGLKELRASKPKFDSSKTVEIITDARATLDRLMAKCDLVGLKREMAFAFWERGLQPDAAEAVHTGLAEKIRDDADGQEVMLTTLRHYLPDPGYQSKSGLTLYGGAALCIHLAQLAGMDRDQVRKDAFEQFLERADRAE